ncbi:MAG: hypothetical protein JJLCMIEE_03372 [Acidimicrobiales bacterium]|nr:MAG: N-acetyltransferase [Actinomycetota bacterium]MBV6510241.1 hypothetical protein [Acidimicrobiales bacterium]RIK04207.1 MAG: hypothetical protein DCC48_14025 [Acidobacteriota bacterium]
MNHLFETYGFFKIYAEVPEFNFEAFASWDKLFSEEGHLVDHERFAGRRWDRLILALTRSQWDDNRPWVARMCGLPTEEQ